jgi:antirestriction protein ArdC
MLNYQTIISGLMSKGIPASEIIPRKNVLTFNAWQALGRTVRKGEKGIKCITWVVMTDKDGNETKRPKTAYVFHISQTEPLKG